MGWLYEKFFQQDEPEPEPKEDASAILAWGQMAEFERTMEWLSTEADKPIPLGDPYAIIAGGARANAFKEVRNHLKVRQRNAAALMRRAREEQQNA